MKKNNSGFSLIELVLSLAIFMIASLSIYQFVIIASKHYQKGAVEVDLQYESQLSMNQLNDLLIDATRGVSYSVNSGAQKIINDAEITHAPVTDKELFIYNEGKYYVITWDVASQTLLYSEYQQDAGSNWILDTNKVLMSEYVQDFEVDLSDFDESRIVRLSVNFQNTGDYRVTQNVTLRNDVAINKELGELY